MRILMLTQFYPPFIGGEEQVVSSLSQELARRGHQVSVATMAAPGLPGFDIEDGVRVHRMRATVHRLPGLSQDPERRHAPPLPDPELVAALWRIIRREQPDIVHAHNWLVHSYFPLKPLAGARLALSLHDYSFVCATKKLLYGERPCEGPALQKCLHCAGVHYGKRKGRLIAAATWTGSYAGRRLVDVFLPVSEAAARANGLLDRGLPVRIVPNFLPESASPCDRQEIDRYLARLPREPFLLFVGAFGAYKGVDVLLQAYSELNDAPPLVLIGYETAESPVQTRALPRNVTVLKDWPHAAVMEAWQRSLMAIVPSIVAETFGMVALEAMSVGRAVIASRIGGLPDIVADRQTGLLVPPGDAIALRSAIQTLLDDVDLRDRLGRAGRESARRFSARTVVSEYEQIYAGMIDGKTFDGAGEINPLPVMMEARP